MAETERLEAIGPRGEACIIIRAWSTPETTAVGDAAREQRRPSYRLATGERLSTTDDSTVFETPDRSRRFTLRHMP